MAGLFGLLTMKAVRSSTAVYNRVVESGIMACVSARTVS